MVIPRPLRLVIVSVLVVAGPVASGPVPVVVRTTAETAAPLCGLPVDAEVIDGFRPPPEPWLPGNRGLTYGTVPGQPVRSVAEGVVSFAGPIAGARYVTVRLDDGHDVTYSYLAGTPRKAGDRVVVGDPIGVTGSEPFHLGYLDGSAYRDPTELVVAVCDLHHAVLVPVPDNPETVSSGVR